MIGGVEPIRLIDHTHAASPRGKIGLITGAATGQPELRRQAEELGVAYYDDDHLKSFNKDKKRIKKWGA
jgi:hypothetical protein